MEGYTEAELDVNTRKKKLKLDLKVGFNVGFNKRTFGVENESNSPVALSSPDLQKLLLKTPELENLILLQSGLTDFAPTRDPMDNIPPDPIQHRAPGDVESSLQEIQDPFRQSADHPRIDELNAYCGTTSINSQRANAFQPDTSTWPDTSSYRAFPDDEIQRNRVDALDLYLLNVENQQMAKLEQRRMKNRAAASKCRRRKLEKIAHLEEKAKLLKGENANLTAFMLDLKNQVCQLKNQVLGHVNNGCRINHYY